MSSGDERVEQIWPSERDAKVEAEVLCFVLEEHPGHLTIGELLTALRGASEDFARTDALRRAIRGLAAAGLLHQEGATLTPTRAARRFAALFRWVGRRGGLVRTPAVGGLRCGRGRG